jgi:hypothetical protein
VLLQSWSLLFLLQTTTVETESLLEQAQLSSFSIKLIGVVIQIKIISDVESTGTLSTASHLAVVESLQEFIGAGSTIDSCHTFSSKIYCKCLGNFVDCMSLCSNQSTFCMKSFAAEFDPQRAATMRS